MSLLLAAASAEAFSFAPPTTLRRPNIAAVSAALPALRAPGLLSRSVSGQLRPRAAPLSVCAMAGEVVDNVAVVLLAGGVGSRMKAGKPKQFLEIEGKTILRTSLDVFLGLKGVTSISIVLAEEYRDQLADVAAADPRACDPLPFPPPVFCCWLPTESAPRTLPTAPRPDIAHGRRDRDKVCCAG